LASPDSLTLLNRKRVFDYALQHRLPAIYEQDFIARDGGLMSYGADAGESFDRGRTGCPHLSGREARRSASRDPDALPIRHQHDNRFVINMKTAK